MASTQAVPDCPDVQFRTAKPEDLPFLLRLYASTRAEELSLVPWTDEQKREFLRMQFEAQHKHYHEHFSDAQFSIIEVNGAVAGRLYLQRREQEYRIIDIALLPEFRGQGIGGRILSDVLHAAAEDGKPVRIHVEQNNPAMRLYERLGFIKSDESGVYFLLEKSPQAL